MTLGCSCCACWNCIVGCYSVLLFHSLGKKFQLLYCTVLFIQCSWRDGLRYEVNVSRVLVRCLSRVLLQLAMGLLVCSLSFKVVTGLMYECSNIRAEMLFYRVHFVYERTFTVHVPVLCFHYLIMTLHDRAEFFKERGKRTGCEISNFFSEKNRSSTLTRFCRKIF